MKEKISDYEDKGYSFTPEVYKETYRLSRGIPRMMDRAIELSIWAANLQQQRAIDILLVEKVGREIVFTNREDCSMTGV